MSKSSEPAELVPAWSSAIQTRDFDDFRALFTAGAVDIRQLSRGRFLGSIQEIALTAGLRLQRTRANRRCLAQGGEDPSTYSLGLVTKSSAGASWRKQRLEPGSIVMRGPGAPAIHQTSDDYDCSFCAVDARVLRDAVVVLSGIELDETLGSWMAIRPPNASFEQLERGLARVFALDDGMWAVGADRRAQLAEMILTRIVQAIATHSQDSIPPPPISERVRLVHRTEEFMLAHLDQTLSILGLCAELGVRERTLRYAFQDRHDVGPMTYFKYLKLNAVRSALKSAPDASAPDVSATVEEIARRWGFQHRAHFAADYMKLFGELPSITRYGRKQVAGASCVPRERGVLR